MTGYDANGSPVEDDAKAAAVEWLKARARRELNPPTPSQIAYLAALMVEHFGCIEKVMEWFPAERIFDAFECGQSITYFEREYWRGEECRGCGEPNALHRIYKNDFTNETWKYCGACLLKSGHPLPAAKPEKLELLFNDPHPECPTCGWRAATCSCDDDKFFGE